MTKILNWDNYWESSWKTTHHGKDYYIFLNYTEQRKMVFHISECTNAEFQGSIGSDFNSFEEAEYFLLSQLKLIKSLEAVAIYE